MTLAGERGDVTPRDWHARPAPALRGGGDGDEPFHGAPLGFRVRLRRDLRLGVTPGLRSFWELARVMLPAYGIALVPERLGAIGWRSWAARPLLSLLGLPGDPAVALVVGYLLDIYAAVARCRPGSLALGFRCRLRRQPGRSGTLTRRTDFPYC